jgi:putative membrane protein
MLILSIVPTLIFYFLGWNWLAIPWVPVALLGTATAFISGFKNTQTYNRTWEARQIYGAIINSSRALGIMVRDFVRSNDKVRESALHKEIIYRHFAWLTAMRFQLRETKSWENVKTRSYYKEYLQYYKVPEWETQLPDELKPFLSESELQYILSTKNRATQILATQSEHLRKLNEEGVISDYNYVALENQLKDLYDQQGKCERIKNFPYPRQFTSINLYFTNMLCFLLPFGFLGEFSKMTEKFGEHIIWLTIPFSVLVGWVFLVLEQIGESTENPFEGNPNDIPITQISRNIEIDLREMIGETDLPPALQPVNNILM